MKIGLLYNACNYTWNGNELDHSLFSEITKLKEGFEQANYEVNLINGVDNLVSYISQDSSRATWDLIMNYIPWTRTLQKESATDFLDFYKIPYIGNSHKSLMICADKYISKLLVKELQIPIPKYLYQEFPYRKPLEYEKIKYELGSPFVMKANGTSGSLGVRKIYNVSAYKEAWKELTSKWHEGVLFEEYIEGTDLTIPVLSRNKKPHALGVIQYVDSNNNFIPFFTRNIKYYEKISCRPFKDNEISTLLKNYAEKIHIATQCTIFSRCDFRITNDGTVYFLECNATPSLNPEGAFVTAGNLSFSNLLQHIVKEAQL